MTMCAPMTQNGWLENIFFGNQRAMPPGPWGPGPQPLSPWSPGPRSPGPLAPPPLGPQPQPQPPLAPRSWMRPWCRALRAPTECCCSQSEMFTAAVKLCGFSRPLWSGAGQVRPGAHRGRQVGVKSVRFGVQRLTHLVLRKFEADWLCRRQIWREPV